MWFKNTASVAILFVHLVILLHTYMFKCCKKKCYNCTNILQVQLTDHLVLGFLFQAHVECNMGTQWLLLQHSWLPGESSHDNHHSGQRATVGQGKMTAAARLHTKWLFKCVSDYFWVDKLTVELTQWGVFTGHWCLSLHANSRVISYITGLFV